MRVFLTGGTGFLGGRVAAFLRARGDDVVALSRSTSDMAALRSIGAAIASLVAELVRAHLAGVLVAASFPELTMSVVFVDDAARGLIAIADRGRDGRAYNLVGEVMTMGGWLARMAEITGRPAPKARIPTFAVRAAAKTFPFVAGLAGLGPSLAREGLGWTTTGLDEALARTLIAFERRGGDRFRPTTERARRALRIARGEASARAEAVS